MKTTLTGLVEHLWSHLCSDLEEKMGVRAGKGAEFATDHQTEVNSDANSVKIMMNR